MSDAVSQGEADDADQEQANAEAEHRANAKRELSVIAGGGLQLFPAEVSNHYCPRIRTTFGEGC